MRMSEQEIGKIAPASGGTKVEITPTVVKGVDIYHFPWVQDSRGDLTVGEFEKEFPFRPKRYFIVSGVPKGEIRGEHAHKACHQFLICSLRFGGASVVDGATRLEIQLDKPNIGIHRPPISTMRLRQ